jgi:hypothetical protein
MNERLDVATSDRAAQERVKLLFSTNSYLKSWRHQNNVCIDRKVAVYSSVTLEYLAAAGVSELAGTSGALSSLSMYLLVS